MYEVEIRGEDQTITEKLGPNQVAVRIGEHRRFYTNGLGETGIEEWRNAKKIHIHSGYPFKDNYIGQKMTGQLFDIAILELELVIDLTKYTPACLATENDGTTFDGKDLTVVGWGRTKPDMHSFFVNAPHETNLTVVENCQFMPGPWAFCFGLYNPGKGVCHVSLD